MKRYRSILIGGLVLLLLIWGGVYLGTQRKANPPTQRETTARIFADVTITADGDSTVYTGVPVEERTTALALTQKVAQVETSGEGEMAFVTSLNGRAASDEKQEFWAFHVNGELAQVGSGSYIVQNGDRIEWRIETY